MTVGKLKEQLKQFPEELEVFLAERKSDFDNAPLQSVYPLEISFTEEPGGKVLAKSTYLVLDEE